MTNRQIHATRIVGNPLWTNSERIHTFSDDDRHLGHILRAGKWHVFNATRPNTAGDGYLYLGAFDRRADAMEALEKSIAENSILTMTAR